LIFWVFIEVGMEFDLWRRREVLALPIGQMDVWWVDFTLHKHDYERCQSYLSSSQLSRMRRFVHYAGRFQYAVSHAALNSILSAYTGTPCERLNFHTGEKGKPMLADSSVFFNLSHSHQAAVIAVAAAPHVGVDVEWVREKSGFMAIAQRYFSTQEVAWVSAAKDLSHKLERFYQVWVCKEAYLKAVGLGLTVSLDQFSVLLDMPGGACRLDGAGDIGAHSLYNYFYVSAGDKYNLAYCWRSGIETVRAREWRLSCLGS
jgi:4'-phosphopantetheinyl transferase